MQGKDVDSDYHNRGIEDILENEMLVENPIRSDKYTKMLSAADDYFILLEMQKHAAPCPNHLLC